MTELTGMTPQELSDWCKAQGMPAFRGKQIFRWIHQGADFGLQAAPDKIANQQKME